MLLEKYPDLREIEGEEGVLQAMQTLMPHSGCTVA